MDRGPGYPTGCTRIELRFEDGSSFSGVSPFRIADDIRAAIGEVEAAKPTSSGTLLVTAKDTDQAYRILQLDRLIERSIIAEPAEKQPTIEALLHAPSLIDVPDDEIIYELRSQGVIGVRRLRPRNGRPNSGLRLAFIGNTIPATIRAGFEDF